MADIDDLRERVEAARKRFGLMDEQQQRYSERLVGLMDVVDDGIRQQRAHADDLQVEVDKLSHENDELKTMLHALLMAVENDNGSGLSTTMQMLESRANALVETADVSAALPSPQADASDAAPESEPGEDRPDENLDDDVPVTPPTPWDEEPVVEPGDHGGDETRAESESTDHAGASTDSTVSEDPAPESTGAEAPLGEDEQEPIASPDVEARVKRLIEMTGGSSGGG